MQERRLAAIMFTDIVGYTRLMGEDEDRAFEVLGKNREIHTDLIEKFNGTLNKEMGDGMLISFNLTSDAVRCAIEIQEACKEKEIPLKIGIHEGEMVFEDNDVLGDGVNIASRIQNDTEAGCIMISGAVYRDIKNKVDIQTEFIEEKQFKNVDEPVKVYKVHCKKEADKPESSFTSRQTKVQQPVSKKNKLPYYIIAGIVVIIVALLIWYNTKEKASQELEKSIAVLPFINDSEEEGTKYFANGVMEEIMNNLSKISELHVISRTSTEKYRETELGSKQIAEELGVNYLLEGSVRRAGSDVRIYAQLIDAINDKHIWSNSYDRSLKDILKLESDVAQTIAYELKAIITPLEKQIIEKIPTTNLKAYDYYLRALEEHSKYKTDNSKGTKNENALNKAVLFFRLALEHDSSFAKAYTGLARSYRDKYWNESYFEDYFLDSTLALANIALSFDNHLDEAYAIRGGYFSSRNMIDEAIREYKLGIKYNPNHWQSYASLAGLYLQIRDYVKVIESLQKVLKLDHGENLPNKLRSLGITFGHLKMGNLAIKYFQEAVKLDQDSIEYNKNLEYLERIKYEKGLIIFEKSLESAMKRVESDSTLMSSLSHQIAYANSVLGNHNEAYKYWKIYSDQLKELDRPGISVSHRIGYGFWQAGYKEEAKNYFKVHLYHCKESIKLGRPYANRMGAYYDLAGYYGFMGEKEKAYNYLEEEFLSQNYFSPYWFEYILYDPMFSDIRGEERFQNIILEMEHKNQEERERVRIWLGENDML